MEDRQILAGRYQLLRKLGSGGMAVVYLAYDTALDRQVAIKLLREEYADDPNFIRQFQKEAKAVARLSHQNIVNIYDFGESNGQTYLVIEYVDGYTLKELIAQGPLPISQVLDYSIQICYGMAQAHSQGIVHKDIKPHNIMIDRNHVVKIADFGIAQAANNLTITHNKGILGSAHYFSPEQARGEHVDFESDIYSLGVVMYEMTTGQVPFTGDNPVSVALKHMQDPPPSILAQRPDTPPELERIIFKALEKSPANRFASMQEMAEALIDLQRHLEEQDYFQNEVPYRAEQFGNGAEKGGGQHSTRVLQHSYPQEVESLSETKQEKPRNPRKPRRTRIVVLVLAAVLLFLGSFFAIQALMGSDEVEVPDVTGRTVLEAESLLSEASLKIRVDEEVNDETVEKDHIISQLPKGGTNVKEGREIEVVVSLGPDAITVPDLEGMTEVEARIALENAGLELGSVADTTDSQQPVGVVVYQSVEAGHAADAGDPVDVMINRAPAVKMTKVPSLTGKTQSEAQKALSNAGLATGSVSRENSSEYYKDIVIRQQNDAGSSVEAGSAVSFTVSNGPGPEQSAQFELIIPADGTVKAVLSDRNVSGDVIFQKECVAGERVQQSFLYHGSATLVITCNGEEIWSQSYDGA